MSEQITHLAMLDDCRRLVTAMDRDFLSESFTEVLDEYHDSARMGSLSRGNRQNVIREVKRARTHWDERREDDLFTRRLAFVLGWHVHRATDRYFKPRYRKLDPRYDETGTRENHIKILHDAIVYDEVYRDDSASPFSTGTMELTMGSHPASSAIDVVGVERFFQNKWMVELLGAHAFVADRESAPTEERINQLIATRQEVSYRTQWYEEATYDPDPVHLKQYITEPNFYDHRDQIIQLARSIQQGERPEGDLADVVRSPGESQYAEALADSLRYLRIGSDLFEGKISDEEAGERLSLWWFMDESDEPPPADRRPETATEPPADVDAAVHPHLQQPIAEIAAVDDCIHVASLDEELTDRTQTALRTNRDVAPVAGLVEPGDWVVSVLDTSKSEFAYRLPHADAKIAVVGGLCCIAAARRTFGATGDELSDDRLLQDVTILRERSTRRDPTAADANAIQDLLEGFLPRARQRWHTLIPDRTHFVPWSERFFAWRDHYGEILEQYAELYADGEGAPATFYDSDDPLIRVARAGREGGRESVPSVHEALADDGGRCTYADVLQEGVEGIRAIDAYVNGELERTDLKTRLSLSETSEERTSASASGG